VPTSQVPQLQTQLAPLAGTDTTKMISSSVASTEPVIPPASTKTEIAPLMAPTQQLASLSEPQGQTVAASTSETAAPLIATTEQA
jgi:hypothetical protein